MGHETIALWTDTSSDPELIAGVRAGDSAAFGVLYERHSDAARKVAAQYTNTPSDIDDVVSESFSRVLRALQQGDGPDLAFRAYLFTIVRRTGMDLINKGIRTRPRDDMSPYESALGYEASSDEPAMEGFEHGLVADAFKSLPERWQAVLWYTEVEKKSPKEIAPLLGLSANGVAALSYRAREALRQAYLQQHLSSANDIDCLEVNSQLGAFVRGGLNKRESSKVDGHIATCVQCAALVSELEDVNRGMRSIIAPLVMGALGVGALEGGLPIGGAFGTGAAGLTAAGGGGAAAGGGTAGAGAATGGSAAGGVAAGGAAAGGTAVAGAGAATLAAAAAAVSSGGASASSAATAVGAGTSGMGATAAAANVVGAGAGSTIPAVAASASASSAAAAASLAAPLAAPSFVAAPAAGATGLGATGLTAAGPAAFPMAAGAPAAWGATGAAPVAVGAGVGASSTAGMAGLFVGASAFLVPAAAVAGVAALAFAGASYLGAFDTPVGDGPSALQTLPPVSQDTVTESGADAGADGESLSDPLPSSAAEPSAPPVDKAAVPAPPVAKAAVPAPPVAKAPVPAPPVPVPGEPSNQGGTNGAEPGTTNPGTTNPGTANPGTTTPGGTGGTGGTTGAPRLTLAKAPLDYLEIAQSSPALAMSVANLGDAPASTLEGTITLPAGLTFAAPSGGAAPLMSVRSERLSDFLQFSLTDTFDAGDWTCTLTSDAATADCTLDELVPGGTTTLDLDVTIASTLAADALTTFTVVSGDQTLTYSVLTGIEVNEENVAPIYVADGHLAALHVGATLMGCDTTESGCNGTMAGTGSTKFNNNDFRMVALNESGGVRNSASTQLKVPAGATVKYATLEWAANRYNGSTTPGRESRADAFDGALDSARLRAPGGQYVPITADTVSQTKDPAGRVYYQARLDITDMVKASGNGEWSLADIALASTRYDWDRTYFGGFAITVVYEDPSLADSRLTIFDGAEWVSENNMADFTFSTSAPSKVTLGWVSFEGDRGASGDRLDINGDTFAPCRWNGNSTSTGDSGNAADATAFGGKYGNSLGIDAKLFRPNTVPSGTHAITVRTSGDNFLLSTLTVAISNDTSGPNACKAP